MDKVDQKMKRGPRAPDRVFVLLRHAECMKNQWKINDFAIGCFEVKGSRWGPLRLLRASAGAGIRNVNRSGRKNLRQRVDMGDGHSHEAGKRRGK